MSPIPSCLTPPLLLDVSPSYIHVCLITDEEVSVWGSRNRIKNHLRGIKGPPQSKKENKECVECKRRDEKRENVKTWRCFLPCSWVKHKSVINMLEVESKHLCIFSIQEHINPNLNIQVIHEYYKCPLTESHNLTCWCPALLSNFWHLATCIFIFYLGYASS